MNIIPSQLNGEFPNKLYVKVLVHEVIFRLVECLELLKCLSFSSKHPSILLYVISFKKMSKNQGLIWRHCQKHIYVGRENIWRGRGWVGEREVDFSSNVVTSSWKGWRLSMRGGALWSLLLNQGVELMCTLPLARHQSWDTSSSFPLHLISHFNNVYIWQKAFWKHVECVGGILEYKEEFVPSDQEARKCRG